MENKFIKNELSNTPTSGMWKIKSVLIGGSWRLLFKVNPSTKRTQGTSNNLQQSQVQARRTTSRRSFFFGHRNTRASQLPTMSAYILTSIGSKPASQMELG